MGVRAGNCGGNAGGANAGGTVNPITGIRARPGSIYERVLNAGGIRGGQAGGGLFGNNRIVQAINANGGLLAVDPNDGSALPASAASQPLPGWAVAGIVILSMIVVATITVVVQLVILVRKA
jgi:hypothetical protein